jgi:hypothetical protein
MDLERGLMPLEKADEVLIPVQKDLSELLSEVQTFVDQKESPSISY